MSRPSVYKRRTGAGLALALVIGVVVVPAVTAAPAAAAVAAPVVTAVSPAAGPTSGGRSVTITGTGLTGAMAVRFGVVPAATFTVASATRITATTPADVVGVVDVRSVNHDSGMQLTLDSREPLADVSQVVGGLCGVTSGLTAARTTR